MRKPPKAKRVAYGEGLDWADWVEWPGTAAVPTKNIFAVEFEDGWIWDRLCGWRRLKKKK